MADRRVLGNQRDGTFRVHIFGDPVDHCEFFFGKRFKVFHIGHVVLHLAQCAHAGKHHENSRLACRVADRPGRGRLFGIQCFQALSVFRPGICKNAALDRLHDDHFPSVADDGLVAGPDVNAFVLHIRIVQDHLDILDIRLFSKDTLKHIHGVMEGDADVTDPAFFF